MTIFENKLFEEIKVNEVFGGRRVSILTGDLTRDEDTDTQREYHVKTQEENSRPPARWRGLR